MVDSNGNTNQLQTSNTIVASNMVEPTGNNGICDIFEAIALANHLSDPENFPQPTDVNGIVNEDCNPSLTNPTLPEGVFGITLLPNTYVFTEEQTIAGNIVISTNNPASYATITRLDLFGNQHRLLNVTGSLTLENIIISNGHADNGGGILNEGELTIKNSIVTRNFAINNGGGIYNSGTLVVEDSTIRDNRAGLTGLADTNFVIGNSNGGGIYNLGNLTISTTNIYMNRTDNQGGGIFNAGSLSIIGSHIARNVAVNVLVDSRHLNFVSSPTGRQDSQGGGIYHTGAGLANVTNSCIIAVSGIE